MAKTIDRQQAIDALEAVQAALNAKAAEGNLLAFAVQIRGEKFDTSPFHRNYIKVLQAFLKGKIKKLIVSMPPQHGKSEMSSRLLPACLLGVNPDLRISICSYSATLAKSFSIDVQNIIMSEEYQSIFPGTRLAKNAPKDDNNTSKDKQTESMFSIVGHKGKLIAVGRGGALTGQTIDISILDDLYASYAEGNSPVIRDKTWSWYVSVPKSRLHKGGQELIVFTRWNKDDVIGRILDKQPHKKIESLDDIKGADDKTWFVLNYPAIKVGEPTPIDPREEGESLWEEFHTKEELLERKSLDSNQFECLYQGDPGNAEGRLYQPFKTYVDKSEWGKLIRKGAYTDVADEGSDDLAHICYDVYLSPNQYYDEQKQRMMPIINILVTDMILTSANTDKTIPMTTDSVNAQGTQLWWVESNNGGSGFEKAARKRVRCLTHPFYQGSNKEARILTNAAGVNRSFIFPFGWEEKWAKAYEHLTNYLSDFKANSHDDIEDALTGIYEKEVMPGNVQPYNSAHRGVSIANR